MCSSDLDAQGLGNIEVPAEWAAVAIYAAVNGINVWQACHWTPCRNSADGELECRIDKVTPGRLVTMVSAISGYDEGQDTRLREDFARALGAKVRKGEVAA